MEIARRRGALLTLYLIAVFGLTLTPVSEPPDAPQSFDKVVHFGLFGFLAVLVNWNLWWARLRASAAALAAAAVAGLIELLQRPIPYRSADVWDFVAGTAGAIAVGGVIGLWGRVGGGSSRPSVGR
jgi:VanZ family protein